MTVHPPSILYLRLSSPICWSISQKADSRAPMTRDSQEISRVGNHIAEFPLTEVTESLPTA